MPHAVDLQFQGLPGVIATAVLPCGDGVVLVDPGPSSCLGALTRGLERLGVALDDVRAVLVTHIHLDHAGACGTLAAALPDLRIFVHELGATHLAAPDRLLASVTRLYGSEMDRLWGEFKAVPASALTALTGGERLTIGTRAFDVAYTPGHAVHHVGYLDVADRVAYVGDTAGLVVGGYLMAPTPPPDIDLEAWERSLGVIEAWGPSALFLTHFGEIGAPAPHLARLRAALRRAAAVVREGLESGRDEARQLADWVEWLRTDAREAASEEAARLVETAAPFDQGWQGLARYWRKRWQRDARAAAGTPPPA
ncbi:MAG: MBL fold metallo-hydrolase [Vicinamibacterales bacterium]